MSIRYAQVVHEQIPILIESPLEDCEYKFLEVLRTISRAKGQAARQVRTANGQGSHLLRRLRLVLDLQ